MILARQTMKTMKTIWSLRDEVVPINEGSKHLIATFDLAISDDENNEHNTVITRSARSTCNIDALILRHSAQC